MVAAAVRDALDRMPLERALQLAIAALIVTTVLSAGALLSWVGPARKLRWAVLLVFAALALLYAFRRVDRHLGLVHAGGAVLCALALASAAWSAFPRVTLARAGVFVVLIVACGALAVGVAGRPESARRFVDAIVGGVALVAVGGLLVLAFRHDRAVQPATSALAARYQGLGGGPNTATMVLAVATPLAAYALFEARRLLDRALALAVVLLVLGSIVASGSRGALVGGFGGLFAYAVLAPVALRPRLIAGAAVVALLAVAILVTRIPQPDPDAPALPSAQEPQAPRPPPGKRPISPLEPPRLSDDVGHPPFGVADTTRRPRTLFGSSGRAQAWEGAIELGADRPVAGYGFGTEDRVFVDRYVEFNSNVTENSYVGLFLQLGAVGLAVFVALLGTVVARGVGALRRVDRSERRLVAACLGAVVAGLLLAFFQSYVYAVGNNATAAFWICVFLLAALARPAGAREAG